MGGVAEQGDARDPLPAVLVGQRVQDPYDRCGLAVGEQRRELRRPALELLGDPGRCRAGVGEVDGVDPLPFPGQLDVGVQDPAGLPVGGDPLSGSEREQGAAADRLGARGMALVAVEKIGLDEDGAGVLGPRPGQQRANA